MISEELVDVIAESIFCSLRDASVIISKKDYANLIDREKELYRSMAHNILHIFDDYYDGEYDDEDFEDEDDDDDDFNWPLDD